MRNRINSKGTTLIKMFKKAISILKNSHFKRNKTDFFIKYTALNGKNNFNLIDDTWFMKRIKSSTKRLFDLQADAALISKMWHGESEIANYTASHYKQTNFSWNSPFFSEESSPDLMFDDEHDTFWLPRRFSNGPLKIVVRFKVSFSTYFYRTNFIGILILN